MRLATIPDEETGIGRCAGLFEEMVRRGLQCSVSWGRPPFVPFVATGNGRVEVVPVCGGYDVFHLDLSKMPSERVSREAALAALIDAETLQ